MPTSYPPNNTLSDDDKEYVFYEKKTTVFYADLEVGKKYRLFIELDGLGPFFENVPIFPYGNVNYIKTTYSTSTDITLDISFMGVKPVRSKILPEYLVTKLYRDERLSFPAGLLPAFPYRGNVPAFPLDGTYGLPDTEDVIELDKFIIYPEKIINFELKEYWAFRMVFGIFIPPTKTIDINVKTPRTPIPSRIYEQLQNLDRYDDVLVEYQILNLTEVQRRIILETNIEGLTDISREIFLLPGMNDPTKKPVIVKRQTPLLKHGILANLVSPTRSTLSCKVLDSNTQEILYHETFKIDILPHDQMLFGISSVSSSTNYSLSQFLGAWITPNDKEGLLDTARVGAARLHPEGLISIEDSQSLMEIDQIVGAVFVYLKNQGMIYVNQLFTSKVMTDSQRVLLPETVLKNNSGNCIDLTITFASILEGFGIYSLIFLTPNHAFIGWGNRNKTKEMLFLETTMIGTYTYEDAKVAGERVFRENFLFHGCEDLLALGIKESIGYEILDLKKIRHEGIARIC